jgi:hypothetical protein
MALKELNKFIKSYYDNQDVLVSPAFYNSKVAIRFEIGDPSIDYNDPEYLKGAYEKAIELFEQVFDPNSKIYLVINTYNKNETEIKEILKDYLKPKVININSEHIEDNDIILTRHCINCKFKDINYKKLLPAICNSDMNKQPCIDDHVFFVNKDTRVIYHLYDDRGLDIIANNKDNIINLYEKYNDWILDYDREVIDETFLEKNKK